MSFQAYLDNIQVKAGKSPADFKKMAAQKGSSVELLPKVRDQNGQG